MSSNDIVWRKYISSENGKFIGSTNLTLTLIYELFKVYVYTKVHGFTAKLMAISDNENNYNIIIRADEK